MIKSYLLFLYTLMLFTGCIPDVKDVLGKYYAKHQRGIEYIEIKEDYTYTHFFDDGKMRYQGVGKWRFKHKSSLLYIHLTNWQNVVEYGKTINIDKNQPAGHAFFPYSRSGIIEANVDLEKYCFYKKKE